MRQSQFGSRPQVSGRPVRGAMDSARRIRAIRAGRAGACVLRLGVPSKRRPATLRVADGLSGQSVVAGKALEP